MNIIKRIKNFFENLNYKSKYEILKTEHLASVYSFDQERLDLQKKIGDPRYVVEKVFGRKISYYNPADMSPESRRKYYTQAQSILNSQAFINTKNMIIATQCQEQARQFNPLSPMNVARDVQMTINALELLEEELSDIPNPDGTNDTTSASKDFNPHAGV